MDRPRPTLLLTRPEAQSAEFAAAFRARFGDDWPVVISPLSEIRFLAPDLPVGASGIIFTSQNAVAAVVRLTDDRTPVAWCVGERTAEAARAAGYAVRVGPGDAEGLARAIAASGGTGTFLHAHGRHVARDLTAELLAAGMTPVPVVVYEQTGKDPTDEAMRLVAAADPVLLPLFSPRSARLAGTAFADATAPLLVAAMSAAVADAAAKLGARRAVTAARPDAGAMLDALAALIGAADMP